MKIDSKSFWPKWSFVKSIPGSRLYTRGLADLSMMANEVENTHIKMRILMADSIAKIKLPNG
jgi:hypothetical protein